MRLDLYLKEKFKLHRSHAKNLIKKGKVKVDEKIVSDPNKKIQNSRVEICDSTPEVKLLYECEEFLIVYKPYNMSVCRSITTPKTEYVLNELFIDHNLVKTEKFWEFGLVNRLDKLTEGIILLVKNEIAYLRFKELFKLQKIKKYYRAYYEENYPTFSFKSFICEHNKQYFTLEEKCLCEVPFESQIIQIEENNIIKNCITGLKKEEGYFLCELITGRTHQIRKTMQFIGIPILGDPIYGIKKERMFLFSTTLAF